MSSARAQPGAEDSGKSFREIIQRKFIDEVIGAAANWKVLVMDDVATKVISSGLTMFDIMERRVTIVENLYKSRQPFPEMDVVYFITPTTRSVNAMTADFDNVRKPKYGNVHVIFTDSVPADVMAAIQCHGNFVARVKTFKEINIDFLAQENNVFNLNMPETLAKLYSSLPDPAFPAIVGRKLANVCISLNENPSIRYQSSSSAAREIATVFNQTIQQYKRSNPSFWCYGDDAKQDRERGQMLILDRSFDALSPLMHEYTYQAMVNDLLPIQEGVLTYRTQTNKGGEVEKQALLGENDDLWVELRYSHIAKVIETIKERMNDIIQNSALAKKSGSDMSITTMAAAVKELPEYQQTMSKLGQHVAIAQQCMDAFSKLGLMDLSQIEQTVSTGFDEEGKEVKGAKLLQLVQEAVRSNMSKDQKIRLLAIYIVSQRSATADERRQLIQASGLSGNEQQVFVNFDRVVGSAQTTASSTAAAATTAKTGVFSMFRRSARHAPTPEGEYADTRHVPQLKVLLEQMMQGEMPTDRFPAMGPQAAAKDAKSAARSVRKFGANTRWGNKSEAQFEGGRFFVFVAGGLSYSETRAASELMTAQRKEVIIGSTNMVSPGAFIDIVANLDNSAALPRP